MKAIKLNSSDHCCIIGTWDPPLPEFYELFDELVVYSKENCLRPVAIIMEPNPSIYYAENYYRDYFDVSARVEWLKDFGIFDVVVMNIEKDDLERGAVDFFKELTKVLKIAEIWLGGLQSFGTGESGSQQEISKQCAKYSIKLRILDKTIKVKSSRSKVYKKILKGEFEETLKILGSYPTFDVHTKKQVNFFDGTYRVINKDTLLSKSSVEEKMLTIKDGQFVAQNDFKYRWVSILNTIQ